MLLQILVFGLLKLERRKEYIKYLPQQPKMVLRAINIRTLSF